MFPLQRQSGFARVLVRIVVRVWILAFLFAVPYSPILYSAHADTTPAARQKVAGLLRQGLDLAAKGQLAEAEVLFEQAHSLAPKNTAVLTALAKAKARMGEVPAATELFRQVTALLPHSADAHLDLALTLADQNELNEALTEVTRSIELDPNSGLAHLNRARILSDLNRGQEAQAEFAIAAKLSPSNPDTYYYWALLERQRGDYAKEASLLRTLVKLQPNNDVAYVLLGHALDYQSKRSEAIACWRKALAINPNSEEAVYNLSRALRTTDPSQANALNGQFSSLQQNANTLDQVKTLGNQAYAAINRQNWPLAITKLRRAIAMCGQCKASADLHKDLGLALCQSGDATAGQKELQIALRLNPDDPDTVKALSVISHH